MRYYIADFVVCQLTPCGINEIFPVDNAGISAKTAGRWSFGGNNTECVK